MREGGTPYSLRKRSVKWLWLEKPSSSASAVRSLPCADTCLPEAVDAEAGLGAEHAGQVESRRVESARELVQGQLRVGSDLGLGGLSELAVGRLRADVDRAKRRDGGGDRRLLREQRVGCLRAEVPHEQMLEEVGLACRRGVARHETLAVVELDAVGGELDERFR
jgi:hypothetical protein